MTKGRVHWGKKTPPKGRPTRTQRQAEAAHRAAVAEAQRQDPNIRRLYEAFAPPPGSRVARSR